MIFEQSKSCWVTKHDNDLHPFLIEAVGESTDRLNASDWSWGGIRVSWNRLT